jgi:hypothetical protein
MNRFSKIEGITLVTVGLLLIGFGLNGSGVLGADVSRLFTGTSADRSLWFVPSGIGSTVMGLFSIFKYPGKT